MSHHADMGIHYGKDHLHRLFKDSSVMYLRLTLNSESSCLPTSAGIIVWHHCNYYLEMNTVTHHLRVWSDNVSLGSFIFDCHKCTGMTLLRPVLTMRQHNSVTGFSLICDQLMTALLLWGMWPYAVCVYKKGFCCHVFRYAVTTDHFREA